ncbi:stemmadenine O-acetyltransferase-like [Rosa rugosa]|uniref:stemmadenine O-acetyltransferase-like n=1 Tax=Rosa rugosa TaxID=74645 RepID=UPI002B4086F2|nr:stemmadenine O-acetyltransferase-like [Rosa rugosa]
MEARVKSWTELVTKKFRRPGDAENEKPLTPPSIGLCLSVNESEGPGHHWHCGLYRLHRNANQLNIALTISSSSPTPHHLLSVFDQFSPTIYFPLIFFYPNNRDIHEINNIDPQCLVVERTKLLKRSLSETLSRFYPFAGRIHDHSSVSCNDKGAMFLEAQVNCPISRALEKPDLDFVKKFIPNLQSTEGDTGHDLLLVQANFFECGGIAIGFNVSHKIMDAFRLSTFINSWSATSRGLQLPPHQYVTIESLKSKAASAAVQNPTRVEVVSALIWKCAMKASTANLNSARPSSSAWLQLVNMRKILSQPSAENLMGNHLGFFAAISTKGESKGDLQGLVAAMRKGSEEFKVKYGTNGVGVDDVSKLLKGYGEFLQKGDIECYCSTSWC